MTKFDSEGALGEFFSECDEILQRITATLTKFEVQGLSAETVDSLYRDVHTLKGSAQLFGFQAIGLIAHVIEASLEPVRRRSIGVDRTFIDQIFISLDLIDRILKNPKQDLENDPRLHEELLQILPRLVALSNKRFGSEFEILPSMVLAEKPTTKGIEEKVEAPTAAKAAPVVAPEPEVKKGESAVHVEPVDVTPKAKAPNAAGGDEQQLESSTIRVQVNLLDKLMNLVGEMVLARNQVLQFARTSDNNDFLNLTQRLDLVTSELQDSVMRTRMQPIGSVFTKFQRVVRDLGRELNKKIDIVIEGAETELDKSLLEAIKDPLTHIVRNSCDHGIETPDDRTKAGKNPTGLLSLKAYHEGGHVIIEISDNGRGLDPAKILAKAIEKRVITREKAETLTTSEIQQLIFAPGFSTAEQVSAVSGRGVGMDVVRTNVERVGGMIDLSSTPGKGTKLKLIIPLTLAIVPAMIVRSGGDNFAIPQVKLQELIRVDLEENSKLIDRLQGLYVYRLRGELLPLIDLAGLLSPKATGLASKKVFNIVVVRTEGRAYGLVVDEICDTADIVVKPLPQFLKKIEIFSGSTIMGDGSVALILDIQGVAERSGAHRAGEPQSKQVSEIKVTDEERTEYLFFKLQHGGTFAVPLILVHRLEEFAGSEVESSSTEKMVKYRDSLLPLIDLSGYLTKQDGKLETRETLPVVVVGKHNRLFGLVVSEIQDILSSASDVQGLLREAAGVLGTIIFNEQQVVTVLDALGIIDDALGLPPSKHKNKKKFTNTKILFAEDTVFFVRQVKKVLEAHGIEVDHAENGALAFEKLKKAPGQYRLILSDIEMPQMNGYDFAKAVRAEPASAKIPLIALTTRFNEQDQKRGLAAGFDRYLEKLKSDDLIDAITDLLGANA